MLKEKGYERFNVGLLVTAKNGPLIKVFEDFPFETGLIQGNLKILSLNLTNNPNIMKLMEFEVDINLLMRLNLLKNQTSS